MCRPKKARHWFASCDSGACFFLDGIKTVLFVRLLSDSGRQEAEWVSAQDLAGPWRERTCSLHETTSASVAILDHAWVEPLPPVSAEDRSKPCVSGAAQPGAEEPSLSLPIFPTQTFRLPSSDRARRAAESSDVKNVFVEIVKLKVWLPTIPDHFSALATVLPNLMWIEFIENSAVGSTVSLEPWTSSLRVLDLHDSSCESLDKLVSCLRHLQVLDISNHHAVDDATLAKSLVPSLVAVNLKGCAGMSKLTFGALAKLCSPRSNSACVELFFCNEQKPDIITNIQQFAQLWMLQRPFAVGAQALLALWITLPARDASKTMWKLLTPMCRSLLYLNVADSQSVEYLDLVHVGNIASIRLLVLANCNLGTDICYGEDRSVNVLDPLKRLAPDLRALDLRRNPRLKALDVFEHLQREFFSWTCVYLPVSEGEKIPLDHRVFRGMRGSLHTGDQKHHHEETARVLHQTFLRVMAADQQEEEDDGLWIVDTPPPSPTSDSKSNDAPQEAPQGWPRVSQQAADGQLQQHEQHADIIETASSQESFGTLTQRSTTSQPQ
jgi:hypothetical protein